MLPNNVRLVNFLSCPLIYSQAFWVNACRPCTDWSRIGVPWWTAEVLYRKYLWRTKYTRPELFMVLAFLRHYPRARMLHEVLPYGHRQLLGKAIMAKIRGLIDFLDTVLVEVCFF